MEQLPVPVALPALADTAADLAADQWAPSTRDRYAVSWRTFLAWCRARALSPAPASADAVALYLADRCTDVSISTLETDLAAIGHAHLALDLPSPCDSRKVRAVLRGIRRRHGVPPARKRAISLAELAAMVAALPPTSVRNVRDRAVLVIGWVSAMRRSELAGLDLAHVSEVAEGLRVQIPRSKTDQDGQGQLVALPYAEQHPALCPVVAYRTWLQWSGIESGRVFRRVDRHGNVYDSVSAKSIGRIVKRAGGAIGLPVAELGAHSLRAGLATECAAAGVAERDIARQTRHRSIAVLRTYIRDGSLWTRHPLANVL